MELALVAYTCLNYFMWFSTVYLSIKILICLWTIVRNYIFTFCLSSIDFQKYGQWAVVTGSTDGIGKEFAKKLASKGVDICLISRTEEKLKTTAKEIGDTYGVKTKYIVADFTYTDVYENIRENLAGMDIGILVNNVGIVADNFAPFSERSEQLIRDQINVNILPLALMTSIVTPCMIEKKRGLIVNMGSLIAEVPIPLLTLYCSTKAFMSMFGACVSYELKEHNIQMKTLTPGFIITKFSLKFNKIVLLIKKIAPCFVLNTNRFVNSAFVTLRSGSSTNCGYLGYHIFGAIGKCIPTFLLVMFSKMLQK
ncbi:very-long-chain 3-oxoacyl-CoA reductase-like isoform X1 [Rhodnius prolixus]|uniref:very-long-chain 3-oxoacyl-CoA reductase-like isoform X1 n=1 Tax=Rhodnius prolixus TaxID=13249 RepID=UPI003D189D37